MFLLLVPQPSSQLSITHDGASLTAAQAQALDGKKSIFRVSLDSLPEQAGKYTMYDCTSKDDVLRSVFLPPDQEIPAKEFFTVEATLKIVHHKAWGPFPALMQYRLLDARVK